MQLLAVLCVLVYAVADDAFKENKYWFSNNDGILDDKLYNEFFERHENDKKIFLRSPDYSAENLMETFVEVASGEFKVPEPTDLSGQNIKEKPKNIKRFMKNPPRSTREIVPECIFGHSYNLDCNICHCIGGVMYICTLTNCTKSGNGLFKKIFNEDPSEENYDYEIGHLNYDHYEMDNHLKSNKMFFGDKYDHRNPGLYLREKLKVPIETSRPRLREYAKLKHDFNPNYPVGRSKKKNRQHKWSSVSVKVNNDGCNPDEWVDRNCMTCLCLDGDMGICHWNFCQKSKKTCKIGVNISHGGSMSCTTCSCDQDNTWKCTESQRKCKYGKKCELEKPNIKQNPMTKCGLCYCNSKLQHSCSTDENCALKCTCHTLWTHNKTFF